MSTSTGRGFVCQCYDGKGEKRKQNRVASVGDVMVVEVGAVTTTEHFHPSVVHELAVIRIHIADPPDRNRIHCVTHFRETCLNRNRCGIRLSTRNEDAERVARVKRGSKRCLREGEKLIAFKSTSLVSGTGRKPASSTTSMSSMKTKMSQSPLRQTGHATPTSPIALGWWRESRSPRWPRSTTTCGQSTSRMHSSREPNPKDTLLCTSRGESS